MKTIDVYGIGNPLIDILVNVSDTELADLGVSKGIMHLIDDERRNKLVSHIESKDKTFLCGGSCPNTIITLSSFGVKAALSGKIGQDKFGEIFHNKVTEQNVVNNLKRSEGSTGSTVIMITPDSERTMNTHLGMCQHFTSDDVDEESIKNSKYLYFTGYMWDTDNQKKALTKAINLAKTNNTKIIFDVADPFAVNRHKEDFLMIIKEHADIVFCNKDEAKTLFDTDDSKLCVKKLSELTDIVIVKIGSEGSFVKQKDEETIFVPANKVNAVDTTGAGDTFAAGFIFGICKEFDLKKSAIFASFLASQIVIQKGAQFSSDVQTQIKETIKNNLWDYTSE